MARLPHADRAIVDDAKLRNYIFNPAHKDGWPKGQFLVAHGFDAADAATVAAAFLAHAQAHEVAETEFTMFGEKYRVDGGLLTPSGAEIRIRTVWQIDTGQTYPRFVTMVPLPRQP